ncbi:hypothetical protein PhaeoP23_03963 (plasmid) [Phaeobacter piscinae]|uniref:DUF3768 domain-containing protein n=1 Tax=Phaeobacter piscinae TaxID=1580596 RepID=A0ABM6PK98_9RHOB|nr:MULTISPECIES: DUF3768 domain-containing protein [Phaeobacter]ATG38116.1 hypothetical protein PhaeoP36_04041 [Phaeobacter piscinae]AUQ88637.1 hypothetical protein PhaeoP42_04042 [Phaeobacter piscinae]AUQ92636.1 hypothetical protein PhaeoP24_04078 [Phaeobacter inhibens]AUR26442.1 hypothetical protein PhaeoP23_03963 [Phaeobacter piscinae]
MGFNLMEMSFDQLREALETKAIAQQNDAFRKIKLADASIGRWVITQALNAHGDEYVQQCVQAVRDHTSFEADTDPDGQHDMGFMRVEDRAVWWKIDLYDPTYTFGSEAPAEVCLTRRVLTIGLPSDF